MKGAAGGATYFVFPSAQAIDTQPGMKPGSRVNHRPTSRKKQSRTLISAKERGPSFLYSAHSTSCADFSSLFFSRLQPQDRLEEAKMTGRGERAGWPRGWLNGSVNTGPQNVLESHSGLPVTRGR